MGVQGLKYLVQWHNKKFLVEHKLHDCRIFIDGNNLAYKLYSKTPGITTAFGGDYDKYAAHVTFFFMRLKQCNIVPMVLFDGGQPQDNIKIHTSTTRLQNNLNACLNYNPAQGGTKVFPLNARSVFISVLKRLGVLVLQCDFEADHDLAFLAKKYNAKVVSNDSDFFLHDVEYIPLDCLRYYYIKTITKKDGTVQNALICQLFLREPFLKSLSLRTRDAPVLAAIAGNDCIPPAYLKEFHIYLIGGVKRKSGYTKRQNLIRLAAGFINRHHALTPQQIFEKVCDRSEAHIRENLKSLLNKVASSYMPKDSVLSFWVEQHLLFLESSAHASNSNESVMDVETIAQKELTSIEAEDNASTSTSCKTKVDTTAMLLQSNDMRKTCNCEDKWRGLRSEVDPVLLKAIDRVDDKFIEEHEECRDDDSENSGATDDEEEENYEEQEKEYFEEFDESDDCLEDSVNTAEDSPATELKSPCVEDEENQNEHSIEEDIKDEGIESIVEEVDVNSLSKKQRKKYLERMKHIQRLKRKSIKKQEQAMYEQLKSEQKSSQKKINITGLDANQVIKLVENLQEENRSDTESSSEIGDAEFRHDDNLFDFEDGFKPVVATESSCPHANSNLVTKCGFRLPDWLVYGYRHALLTREVSDMVANNFCISPGQMEMRNKESSFRVVEGIIKIILTMLKGRGSHIKAELPDNGMQPNKGNNKMSRSDSGKVTEGKKFKQRRSANNFRWYIRDQGSLLPENFDLSEIYQEYHLVPSLLSVEQLCLLDRKQMYLDLLFGSEHRKIILESIPDELQFPVVFILFWIRNSFSDINHTHVMALVLTFIMFYVIDDRIGRRRSTKEIPCVHCCLQEEEAFESQLWVKSSVNSMKCNRNTLRVKKQPKSRNNKNKRDSVAKTLKCDTLTLEVEYEVTEASVPHTSDCSTCASTHTSSSLLSHLIDGITDVECCKASNRLSTLHISLSLDNSNYDREFIHTMSEFQAVVHYLNLLNCVMMAPFTPIYMERFWSGTFCYNVYKTLLKYDERNYHLIALLLGPDLHITKFFHILCKTICNITKIKYDFPDIEHADNMSVLEIFFKKDIAEKKKKISKRRNKKKLQKEVDDQFSMDIDDDCHNVAIRSLQLEA